MRKYFLSIALPLLVGSHSCVARTVDPGESLWSMQRLVTQASCDVIIRQSSLSGGVVTLLNPGVYCLAENIIGKIVIGANGVELDLNGKTITNSLSNGIEVNGVANAVIKNGVVAAANNSGVYIKPGSERVTIENVMSRNSIEGVKIESSKSVYINSCTLIANEYGLTASDVSRAVVRDTTATDSEFAGFLLNASSKNLFARCHALNTGQGLTSQTVNIYGFVSSDGSSNIFRECMAQNTLALTVTVSPNVAAGFALTGTESSSQITQCTTDVVQTSPDGFSVPYGILLKYNFDVLETVTSVTQGGPIWFSFSWSPDGAYLATGGNPNPPGVNDITIFSFDRALGLLTTITEESHGGACASVSWSPDGAFLATGGLNNGANDEIQIFSFDRSTGTLVDGANQGTVATSVSWSPDGAYLATGGTPEAGNEIQVFSFDRSTGMLTKVTDQDQGGTTFLSWSPDGAYLATGPSSGPSSNEMKIFKAFIFPSRNIITNNLVQSASGPSPLVAGVGISGSSIENLITGNTSYNNAGFNYQFVTNIFDERFDQTVPTALQNLSLRLTPPFYRP